MRAVRGSEVIYGKGYRILRSSKLSQEGSQVGSAGETWKSDRILPAEDCLIPRLSRQGGLSRCGDAIRNPVVLAAGDDVASYQFTRIMKGAGRENVVRLSVCEAGKGQQLIFAGGVQVDLFVAG